MVDPLTQFAAEALARVREPHAQEAFAIWSESAHGELAGDDALETFASEAAFAAAARAIVDAGWPAIVDAASLRRADRDAFRHLAHALGVPFAIATCEAPEAVLRARVAARARAGTDASEASAAVLARQVATQEPLDADERRDAVVFRTDGGAAALAAATRALEERLAAVG